MEVRIRARVSTRRDHEGIKSADEIIAILKAENIDGLYPSFFEGRGALKAWFLAGPKLENGYLNVWHAFELLGDEGGKDHHRDPFKYLTLCEDIERRASGLLALDWREKCLESLNVTLYDVKRFKWSLLKRRFKGLIFKNYKYRLGSNEEGWLKNYLSFPKEQIKKIKKGLV